jgi:hypothetical protein
MSDNSLDCEIYPENDDLVGCKPTITRFNAVTGVLETVALSERTDGKAFLSTSELTDGTAEPLSEELNIDLEEIEETAQYAGVMEGAHKTTAFADFADGKVLYRHFHFGSDYHEVKKVTLRKKRRAA